jgi:hypothetical protein
MQLLLSPSVAHRITPDKCRLLGCYAISPILVTLMMEAPGSSETSVLTRATQRKIPEDGILHSHRRENIKPYMALTDWTL